MACSTLAIIISLMKTTVMYQFPRGKADSESNNHVYGQKLQVVEKKFVDLGSTVNVTNNLDDEFLCPPTSEEGESCFSEKRMNPWGISIETKMKVYNT